MESRMKCGLFFLGGIVLGAIGAGMISRGQLRSLTTGLISRGIDAKDAVLAKMETVKENMEDLVAEAQHVSQERKNVKDAG